MWNRGKREQEREPRKGKRGGGGSLGGNTSRDQTQKSRRSRRETPPYSSPQVRDGKGAGVGNGWTGQDRWVQRHMPLRNECQKKYSKLLYYPHLCRSEAKLLHALVPAHASPPKQHIIHDSIPPFQPCKKQQVASSASAGQRLPDLSFQTPSLLG